MAKHDCMTIAVVLCWIELMYVLYCKPIKFGHLDTLQNYFA